MLNNKKLKESKESKELKELKELKPSYWQRTTKDFWKKFFYLLAIVWLSKAGYILGFTYSGILLGILLAIIGGALGITLVNLISLKIFKYKSSDLFLRIDLLDENKNNQTHVSIQKDKLNFIICVSVLCVINIAGSSVFLSNDNKTMQPEANQISSANESKGNKKESVKPQQQETTDNPFAKFEIPETSTSKQKVSTSRSSKELDDDLVVYFSKDFNDAVIITLMNNSRYDDDEMAKKYVNAMKSLYENHKFPTEELINDISEMLNNCKAYDLSSKLQKSMDFLRVKYSS